MQLIDQLLKKLSKNTHTENIIFGWISKNSLHMQCPSLLLLYATRSALSVGCFPRHDRCRSLMLPWSAISTANTAHTSCSQPHTGRLGSSIKTLQKEKQPLDLIFFLISFLSEIKTKRQKNTPATRRCPVRLSTTSAPSRNSANRDVLLNRALTTSTVLARINTLIHSLIWQKQS